MNYKGLRENSQYASFEITDEVAKSVKEQLQSQDSNLISITREDTNKNIVLLKLEKKK